MSDPATDIHQYKAAVFDRKSIGSVSASRDAMAVVEMNLALYREIANAARDDGAQMIVFPEWGLLGTEKAYLSRVAIEPFAQPVGDTGDDLISLDDSFSIVRELASIAKESDMVVVANVCEKTGEGKVYNTEIAIAEDGKLLAKYHKMHPFNTQTFDKPSGKEVVTFDTSFGVTFGVFICKDLFHDEPQRSILKERGVTQIAFSVAFPMDNILTRWNYSRWARKNKATILASNLGGGGGIFAGEDGGAQVEKKEGYTIGTIRV